MTLLASQRFHKLRSLAAVAACALSLVTSVSPAAAATQGTLGATSTGGISISVSVANRAQITGLTDVAFTNIDP